MANKYQHNNRLSWLKM